MSRWRVFGLCMDIEGFLRQNRFPHGYDIFQQDDGTPLAPDAALTFLALERAKGRKVIPYTTECGNPCRHKDRGCTGFDYQGGGCPGRYKEQTHD